MQLQHILPSVLALFSLLLLCLGTGMLSAENRKHKLYTAKTTARIGRLVTKQSGSPDKPGTTRYYPVFEYHANGQFLRVESRIGSDRPQYQEGDEVEICYNPSSRREFYIPGNTAATRIGAVLTIAGLLLAAAALFFLMKFY